jgi:transcriptional regulator with XRE-family HTH domain
VGKDLLVVMLEQRMQERKLSVREAAKEIGVSHTTISRILHAQTTADIHTVIAISNWLGVAPSDLLDGKIEGSKALGAKLASVISAYPELEKVLEEAILKVEKEELSPQVITDLVNYITYRIRT